MNLLLISLLLQHSKVYLEITCLNHISHLMLNRNKHLLWASKYKGARMIYLKELGKQMKVSLAFNKKVMISKCSPWRCLCKEELEVKKTVIFSTQLISLTWQEWTLFLIINLLNTQTVVQLTQVASFLLPWIQINKEHRTTITTIITAVAVAKLIGVTLLLHLTIPHRSLTIHQFVPTVSWIQPSTPSSKIWILLLNLTLNLQFEMNRFISPLILKLQSYLLIQLLV